MREVVVPLTAEVKDAAHELECGDQQSVEVLVPPALHHALVPAVAERHVHRQLQVGYPGHCRVIQGPVACVHYCILVHHVLGTSSQGTHETGFGR